MEGLMIISNQLGDEKKDVALAKLKRIEGRIKGLSNMIEEGRDTQDVLIQLAASQEALRVFGRVLIQHYFENSVANGLNAIDKAKKESTYKDLMDVIYKYVR